MPDQIIIRPPDTTIRDAYRRQAQQLAASGRRPPSLTAWIIDHVLRSIAQDEKGKSKPTGP